MVRIALIALALAGCSRDPGEVLCPRFSAGEIHAKPTSYSQMRDNLSQCQMHFLERYAPLPGPASEAVAASMAECELRADETFQRGVTDNEIADDRDAFNRENRSNLLTMAFQRRYYGCQPPPLAK